MEKKFLKEQNKKNKWQQIKSNKKFWKWIFGSFALIIFGVSISFNIAFVPKYFALKSHEEQNLNINLSVFNDLENNQLLLATKYQSNAQTLGDLMAQDAKTYILSTPGLYGRLLLGVTYEENKTLKSSDKDKTFWAIYYNGESAQVGIDSLYLKNYDKIEIRFQTYG